MDMERLERAFATIAENPELRSEFVKFLVIAEQKYAVIDQDMREEITGPIVDCLFDQTDVIRRTLSDGTIFEFLYRSKIARDFLMSDTRNPDHAWEPQTTRLLIELAKVSKNALVGGAYFGDQAILIAKYLGKPDGLVHAFEPNTDQLAVLMRNAKLNGLENIVPNQAGLWSDDDKTLKLEGFDSFANTVEADFFDENAFKTVSVNKYLADRGESTLGLLMLDIEGAELSALKGASDFLSLSADHAPNIVFEVHRNFVDWSDGLESTEVIKYLVGHGYHMFAIRDYNSNVTMSDKTIELIPLERVFLDGPPHGFNLIAMKSLDLISDLNIRMCENVSPKLLKHRDPALHSPMTAR